MQIDAAVNWGNGKAYVFAETHYVRFDIARGTPDPGYPLEIARYWAGMPVKKVDAILNRGNGKVYFFCGEVYYRVDAQTKKADPGYPLPIADHWHGMPFKTVDAALNLGNGKACFFSGTQFAQFELSNVTMDPGYPKPIDNTTWPGLGLTQVSAAYAGDLRVHKGNALIAHPCFFFSGSQHVLYDLDGRKSVWDGENQIIQVWPGRPSFNRLAGRDLRARTELFLSNLDAIRTAAESDDIARARQLIDDSRPLLDTYLAQISTLLAASDAQIADLVARADRLGQELGALARQLTDLQNHIDTTDSELQKAAASKAALDAQVGSLKTRVKALEKSLKELEDRKKELESWWWVPGYGQYLAIRTLADNDISRLNSARQGLRQNSSQLQKSANAVQRMGQTLATLRANIAEMTEQRSEYERMKAQNDRTLGRVKKRTAFLIGARGSLAEIQAVALDLGQHKLDQLAAALTRLTTHALPADMSVLNRRRSTFADSLREFALSMDEQQDFLTYNPASGNRIVLHSMAVAAVGFRIVAASGGRSVAHPWQSALLLTQTREIRLDQLGLRDMDSVCIEMDPGPFGKKSRSTPIRYIEQPEPEPARFVIYGSFTGIQAAHQP